MSSKELGIQKIEMYEKMIHEQFQPLMDELTVRNHALKSRIESQVKHDLGFYDLEAKLAALETQKTEIENQIFDLRGNNWRYYGNTVTHAADQSPIGIEVNKRLKKLDGLYEQAVEYERRVIKELRLCGVTSDVRELFGNIDKSVKKLSESFKKLPPVNQVLKKIK